MRPTGGENQPQIKGENGKQGWEVIEDEISDANDGDKIVVDMNGADEVPKDYMLTSTGTQTAVWSLSVPIRLTARVRLTLNSHTLPST